jgi:hypothetical protein
LIGTGYKFEKINLVLSLTFTLAEDFLGPADDDEDINSTFVLLHIETVQLVVIQTLIL